MKNLWAPWRMSYIRGEEKREPGCIFEIGEGKKYDRDKLLLYRDSLLVVFLNRFPYANGHLLLAPARHLGDISDLSADENQALMAMLQQSTGILRRRLQPHGFNVGLNLGEVAGAGLADHLHFHVVPRWAGDHNYMTVVGEVRTIPEHIDRTFDLLLADFQNLPSRSA